MQIAVKGATDNFYDQHSKECILQSGDAVLALHNDMWYSAQVMKVIPAGVRVKYKFDSKTEFIAKEEMPERIRIGNPNPDMNETLQQRPELTRFEQISSSHTCPVINQ